MIPLYRVTLPEDKAGRISRFQNIYMRIVLSAFFVEMAVCWLAWDWAQTFANITGIVLFLLWPALQHYYLYEWKPKTQKKEEHECRNRTGNDAGGN